VARIRNQTKRLQLATQQRREVHGEGAEEGADASDVKSKGHEQSLQGGPRKQDEHAAIDIIDEKKRTDGSEKV